MTLDLAAIRERDAGIRKDARFFARTDYEETDSLTGTQAIRDRRSLLAHIDAITEAVEAMDKPEPDTPAWDTLSRPAVLALLRCTPER